MRIEIRDIKFLMKLYKMTEEELHKFLIKRLRKYYNNDKIVNKEGKFIIAVGGNIGLVAHLDVYGKIPPTEIVYNKKHITAIDSILGADDRTGVFIILKMLENGFRPTLIFTHDEEVGGMGARAVADEYSSLGVNYLIQLDRRGEGVVFYGNGNEEFINYILSFRNKKEYGSFSDISTLCPECNVSGCNLGVGYHNEHSHSEYQDIKALEDTLNVVVKMLQDEDSSKYYQYEESETASWFNKYRANSNAGIYEEEKNNLVYYDGEWVSLEEYYNMRYGVYEDNETVGDMYPLEDDTDTPF